MDSLTYAFTEVGDTILVEHHVGVFGIGYDRVVIDKEANREQWIDAVSANYAEAIADNEQELIDAYRAENPSPEVSRLLDELQELVDALRKEEVYTDQKGYQQILAEISEREAQIGNIRSQMAE